MLKRHGMYEKVDEVEKIRMEGFWCIIGKKKYWRSMK